MSWTDEKFTHRYIGSGGILEPHIAELHVTNNRLGFDASCHSAVYHGYLSSENTSSNQGNRVKKESSDEKNMAALRRDAHFSLGRETLHVKVGDYCS